MGSRVTVTDSAFEGGRDGIYLHRADGSVVRNSTFTDNRYGTHLMYTGDALIADNAFRNELFGGITVMTRPSATRSSATTCGTPARGAGVWYPDVRRVQHARRQRTRLLDQLARVAVRAQRGREQRAGRTSDHGRPVEPSRIVANDFVGNADHATAGAGALRSGPTATAGTTGRGKRRGPRARRASVPPDRPGRRCPPPRGRRGRRARVARGRPPRPTPGTVPGRARGASSIRRRRRSRTRRTGSTPRSTRTRDRSVPTGAPNWATVAERATRTQQ